VTPSAHTTITEAAKILGKSRWTVWRMARDGELIAEKLGPTTSLWLLNRAEVERLARKQAAKNGDAA